MKFMFFKFLNKDFSVLNIRVIDQNNIGADLILEPLIKELDNYHNRKELLGKEIEVIVPLDFKESVYLYSNFNVKRIIKSQSESFQDSNGYFCVPLFSSPNKFRILINKSIIHDIQFPGTLYHEFTHVLDFNNYINIYGNPDKMSLKEKRENFYYEFYLWTEFNAKREGMKRLQIEYKKKGFNVAFEEHTKLFINDLKFEHNELRRLYYLVHFLARLSQCGNYFIRRKEKNYPKKFLKEHFGKSVFKLHKVLENTVNFNSFQKNKVKLKKLINY